MTSDHTIAFIVFVFVAAITPGPSNIILASIGANRGVWRGVPALFGTSVGLGVMMFLVAFGLGAIVLDNDTLLRILKWAGIALLLWMSWTIASAKRSELSVKRQLAGFWHLAAFQWINPKSWLVCASAVGAYLSAEHHGALAQSARFGLIFIIVSLPCCTVWLIFGATLQRVLRSPIAQRRFNLAMGCLLAASTVLFLFE